MKNPVQHLPASEHRLEARLDQDALHFFALVALDFDAALLASSFFSGRPIPGKLLTTVTALPPRCAVWRMMSTRPRFVFFFPRLEVFSGTPAGAADDSTFEESSGPAGNPSNPSSAPNGFCVRLSPPSVDMRCFFRPIFLTHRKG